MQRTTVPTERAADAVPSSPPLRVLVADPDADTRALYQIALPVAGCEVIEASDGREALTKALAAPPTLIISELRLPLVDGYALCEILRRDAATRSVPILIVTGEARTTELDRIRNGGADAVFVKPILPDAIVSEVFHLMTDGSNGQPGRGASARKSAIAQPSAPANPQPRSERHRVLSKSHARFSTTTPPAPPPALTCPSCDHSLTYEHSYIGGVSSRYPEQWDEFSCACGIFEYRHRTRKLRRVQ